MSVTVSRDIPQQTSVYRLSQRVALPSQSKATEPSTVLPEGAGVKASAQAITLLDEQQEKRRTSYDQPSARHQHALSAYRSLEHHEKREKLQELFSVDLFA